MKNNKNFEIFLLFIIIILIHSYIPTVKETISDIGSADFNWQPTICVFEGINHYTSYLNRDGICPVFYSQNGEYAQGLYILLYPFTLISWDKAQVIWMVLNITLLFFFSISFFNTGVPWVTLALGDFLVKLLMATAMLIPFKLLSPNIKDFSNKKIYVK